jgi:hypothetical protein
VVSGRGTPRIIRASPVVITDREHHPGRWYVSISGEPDGFAFPETPSSSEEQP